MNIKKRCVVCRKVPIRPNFLLRVVADYYSKDILIRNVCRKCAVKIHEEFIKDNIEKKKNENQTSN
jgi:hypothetical protein